MNEFKWMIENLPVAAALIVMTKMWLSHLRTSDESTRETFKTIAKECEIRAADSKNVIKENTKALAKVNLVMEKHLP